MSDTAALSPPIGGLAPARRLDPAEFEACGLQLRGGEDPDRERARLHCRLGEALFYRGHFAEAVDSARGALALQPDADDILDFGAWLFSNCGRHDLAAEAYERMLARRPGWAAGHRHASGSCAAIGDMDRAIAHAGAASDLDPASFEFAFHAGCLLADRGDPAAGPYLARAAALAPDCPALLHRRSLAALAAGDGEAALALALRACALDAGDRIAAVHASELLLRAGRADAAAALAGDAAARHPDDPVVWRQLSAAEALRDRVAEALAAIERAIALAPAAADYHLHRGNLLYRQGRLDGAAEAFARAAALDPANPAALRSLLTAHFDAGRLAEALAAGGELVRAAPDNEEYARVLLEVLNRRLDVIDGECRVLDDGAGPRRRVAAPPPRRRDALATQRRVIHALIIRETRTRFGESRLGYGWALLEPILHIVMLSLIFAVMMHGRPPIGERFFIFYYTGIIPYHLFVHSSCNMAYAITSNGSLLQLPLVTTLDVAVARGLLELATDLVVAAILLTGFAALGLGAMPHDLFGAALALLVVWLLGCGCGLVNAVLTVSCKSWDKIWVQATRILYFCSGIFYVPAMMPQRVRDLLAWNPVLQAVDWFRAGFFQDYAPHWLDRSYLATVALLAVLAGLALERGRRRHLYEPQ